MSQPDTDGPTAATDEHRELDASRRRITRRIVLVGAGLGLLLALGVGGLGGTGEAGFAVFLLALTLSTACAGLWATATLLYDDLKKRHPSRRRIVVAVGLFVLTGVLMAMLAGVGG